MESRLALGNLDFFFYNKSRKVPIFLLYYAYTEIFIQNKLFRTILNKYICANLRENKIKLPPSRIFINLDPHSVNEITCS